MVIRLITRACITFIIVFSYTSESFALPQLTPKCTNTDVKRPVPSSPVGKIDSGYMLSGDCKTIYVLPPINGKAILSAVAPTSSIHQCPAVRSTLQASNIAADNVKKIQKKQGEALDAGDFDTVVKLAPLVPGFIQAAEQINDSLSNYAPIESATANLLLTMQYGNLLQEYEKLNQDRTIQKIPIKGGFISINVRAPDPLDPLNEVLSTRPGALEIGALGLMTGNLKEFNIIAPQNTNTLIFTDSLAGYVRLSLVGACPFYNKSEQRLIPIDYRQPKKSMIAYLAATYTYFYPVQTSGSYSIEWNMELIGETVRELVETKKGDVSAAVLASDLVNVEGTEAIKVNIHQDLINSLPDDDKIRKQFKVEVVDSFVTDLLSKLGTVVSSSEIPEINADLKSFADEVRVSRHCRRSGFLGLSKRCYNNVYKVKIPVETVKNRTLEILSDLKLRYANETTKVTTILFPGTAGFPIVIK